jgi:hypothetical protein
VTFDPPPGVEHQHRETLAFRVGVGCGLHLMLPKLNRSSPSLTRFIRGADGDSSWWIAPAAGGSGGCST